MHILVVEDEPKVAAFIRQGLEEQLHVVEVAYDGLEGLRLATTGAYQLVVLDLHLPGMGGLEVCRRLRQVNATLPILMLTAMGSTEDVVTGLSAGADDYIVKPFKFREFVARIEALNRRAANASTEAVLQVADLLMDNRAKTVSRAGVPVQLTAREYALLEYFMQNPGRVLSRVDIAEKVWDIGFDTGTNLIDVYVNYLRNKIDRGQPTRLIHTVVGMGYVLKVKGD